MTASHSSCKVFNIAGILVADGGFGFTRGEAENFKRRIQKLIHIESKHTINRSSLINSQQLH